MLWWYRLRFRFYDSFKRARMVRQFGARPTRARMTFLLQQLATAGNDCEGDVIAALRHTRDPRAIDALVGVAISNERAWYRRCEALGALAEIRDTASTPQLIAGLHSLQEPRVMVQAVRTLRALREPLSAPLIRAWGVDALRRRIEDKQNVHTWTEVVAAAGDALNAIGHEPTSEDESLMMDIGANRSKALAARGPSIVAIMATGGLNSKLIAEVLASIDWTGQTERQQRAAAELLRQEICGRLPWTKGCCPDFDKEPWLRDAIRKVPFPGMLSALMPSERWAHSFDWRHYILPQLPVEVFVRGLEDPDVTGRRIASSMLVKSPPFDIVGVLAGRHSDPDSTCRTNAVNALAKMATLPGGAAHVALWFEDLAKFSADVCTSVRSALVELLAVLSDPRAGEMLLQMLDDHDDDVVRVAIRSLCQRRDRRVLSWLASRHSQIKPYDTLEALKELDGAEAANALVPIMLGRVGDVVYRAHSLLSHFLAKRIQAIPSETLRSFRDDLPASRSWEETHEWISESASHDEFRRDTNTYTIDFKPLQHLAGEELLRRQSLADANT